jgi:hypothetical protein
MMIGVTTPLIMLLLSGIGPGQGPPGLLTRWPPKPSAQVILDIFVVSAIYEMLLVTSSVFECPKAYTD